MRKAATITAAAAVLFAAVAKVLSGDPSGINMTEVLLAVSTIAAAFGFQRS